MAPKVVIFGRTHQLGVSELVRGASSLGVGCTLVRPIGAASDEQPSCALAIVVGQHAQAQAIADVYRRRGTPVLALDLPRLRVDDTPRVGLFDDARSAVLPMRTHGRVVAWQPRKRSTKRADVSRVVLCGQMPNDAAHGLSVTEYARTFAQMAQVARATWPDALLSYVPHPLSDMRTPALIADVVDTTVHVHDGITLYLHDATACVTYNSSAGWDAIMLGVPAVHGAPPEQVAWSEYGTRLGHEPRALTERERRVALLRAGASDWTLEECAQGVPLACHLGMQPWPDAVLDDRVEPITTISRPAEEPALCPSP